MHASRLLNCGAISESKARDHCSDGADSETGTGNYTRGMKTKKLDYEAELNLLGITFLPKPSL